MNGLLEKGRKILDFKGDPNVKDAALIAAEQGIEHYEITGYGTARSFARALNMTDIEKIQQDLFFLECFCIILRIITVSNCNFLGR